MALLIFAHNDVCVFDAKTKCIIKHVRCSEDSILYSGTIWGDQSAYCAALGGTVFGQIIVWNPLHLKNVSSDVQEPTHKIDGITVTFLKISNNST